MESFVYVVSIVGKRMFRNQSIQYVAKHIDSLDKIRNKIRHKYGIEFEKTPHYPGFGYIKYKNITTDEDLYLVIEKVDFVI